MRAYIDPLTGKLIPEPAPEAQRELALPQLVPDNSKLELLEMEDGTKGVLFHGQRQATVIAKVQADGSIKTECIESTTALPIQMRTATSEPHHD